MAQSMQVTLRKKGNDLGSATNVRAKEEDDMAASMTVGGEGGVNAGGRVLSAAVDHIRTKKLRPQSNRQSIYGSQNIPTSTNKTLRRH